MQAYQATTPANSNNLQLTTPIQHVPLGMGHMLAYQSQSPRVSPPQHVHSQLPPCACCCGLLHALQEAKTAQDADTIESLTRDLEKARANTANLTADLNTANANHARATQQVAQQQQDHTAALAAQQETYTSVLAEKQQELETLQHQLHDMRGKAEAADADLATARAKVEEDAAAMLKLQEEVKGGALPLQIAHTASVW